MTSDCIFQSNFRGTFGFVALSAFAFWSFALSTGTTSKYGYSPLRSEPHWSRRRLKIIPLTDDGDTAEATAQLRTKAFAQAGSSSSVRSLGGLISDVCVGTN